MLTFKDLQEEVLRRAARDQSGSEFTTAIKNAINSSLFRISREAPWRVMRRKTFFSTNGNYDTGSGSGSFTADSTGVTIDQATFITDGIKIGRRIKLSDDSEYHTIRTITGETGCTISADYGGDDTTTGTYEILGQEEYNLPIQAGHRMFMWHEAYGYPLMLEYITDQCFFGAGLYVTEESIPIAYRMWGEDMIENQVLEPSTLSISSSDSNDQNINVTVFGTVSGYPDYEIITTNASDGTTASAGSKTFSAVERVVKGGSTVGRITVTANSGNCTVATLPVGDTTGGILYKKIQLYPLPDEKYIINVQYYKDPFRLVNDDDIHEMGQEFDEAIILLSIAKIKYEDSQKEGSNFFALYKDEIRNLKKTNIDKIDWFPTLKRPNESVLSSSAVHPYLSYRQIGPHFGSRSRR